AAASLFTAALDTPDEIAAYAGNEAADFGRNFIDGVTSDPATIPTGPETAAAVQQLGETPGPGIDINRTNVVNVVSPLTAEPFQSTGRGDTIYGTITGDAAATANTGDNIDGGNGFDKLQLLVTSGTNTVLTLKSVEQVNVQPIGGT